MYCTITVGLLLSNVSVASLPCSNFDQVAVVEERNQIAIVEEQKVQLANEITATSRCRHRSPTNQKSKSGQQP